MGRFISHVEVWGATDASFESVEARMRSAAEPQALLPKDGTVAARAAVCGIQRRISSSLPGVAGTMRKIYLWTDVDSIQIGRGVDAGWPGIREGLVDPTDGPDGRFTFERMRSASRPGSPELMANLDGDRCRRR